MLGQDYALQDAENNIVYPLKREAYEMVTDLSKQEHLTDSKRINMGSFYTPLRYVSLVSQWLQEEGVLDASVFDPSCGYGAFFTLAVPQAHYDFYGNDIDGEAIKNVVEQFPNVKVFNKNIFTSITRDDFGISKDKPLIVVGNPPYNDVTSQINQKTKQKVKVEFSPIVKTRDLGMSSLLVYNQMKADYVAVLHPLSYLIKKANFSSAKAFFHNYRLVRHIVFNSQEFTNTSKFNGFPVIVALYKRDELNSLTYEQVQRIDFETVGGKRFSLNNWDFVANFIDKYPNRNRYNPELLFYTMRDINALKRSRTFITQRESNAVDIDPDKLKYYCYVDCFKRYANDIPYYMGNLDVPFDYTSFHEIADDCLAISRHYHPEVFGRHPITNAQENSVKNYINHIIGR